MPRYWKVLFGSLIALTVSCGGLNRMLRADPFYRSTGEWDSLRLPLIEPYEAINPLHGEGWGISLPFDLTSELQDLSIMGVDELAVQNGIVLVSARGLWYALVPDVPPGRPFTSREQVEAYAADHGVSEPRWSTPDALYAQFVNTGCLDWIPGCE